MVFRTLNKRNLATSSFWRIKEKNQENPKMNIADGPFLVKLKLVFKLLSLLFAPVTVIDAGKKHNCSCLELCYVSIFIFSFVYSTFQSVLRCALLRQVFMFWEFVNTSRMCCPLNQIL